MRWFVRLLPLVLLTVAATVYVVQVQGLAAYPWRNVIPMLFLVLVAAWVLHKGNGRWTGLGYTWPLAMVGYAVPVIGLTLYLHQGYVTDRDGMVSEAIYPEELFRFLPLYTVTAGVIGFAIGWIVGKNADS